MTRLGWDVTVVTGREKASRRFGGRSSFEGLVFATPAKKFSLSKISKVNAPGMSGPGMAQAVCIDNNDNGCGMCILHH